MMQKKDMEKFVIMLPYDGAEEEKRLNESMKLEEGLEISWNKTKNLDGINVCNIIAQLEDLITLLGSLASIACFCEKRVRIFDSNNKCLKQNIKLKDVITFLKNLKKNK